MPATLAQWGFYDTPAMVPSFSSPVILAGETCNESFDSSYDQNWKRRDKDNICAAGAVDP